MACHVMTTVCSVGSHFLAIFVGSLAHVQTKCDVHLLVCTPADGAQVETLVAKFVAGESERARWHVQRVDVRSARVQEQRARLFDATLTSVPDDALVVLADARDVAFQADPATSLAPRARSALGTNAERATFRDSSWNVHHMKKLAMWEGGDRAWLDRRILNSGLVSGTAEVVRTYLARMARTMRRRGCRYGGCDQAVHNGLLYGGEVEFEILEQVFVGFGSNLGAAPLLTEIDAKGDLRAWGREGEAYAAVHQWDRICERPHFYATYPHAPKGLLKWSDTHLQCYAPASARYVFMRNATASWRVEHGTRRTSACEPDPAACGFCSDSQHACPSA